MDLQKIGACLRDLRKENGLTQEQLAEQMNVSQRTVSRWETGSNTPDLDILIQLADYYEVDLRALLNGERSNMKTLQETKEIVREVTHYQEEQKIRKNKAVKIIAAGVTSNLMIPLAILLVIFGFVPFSEPYDNPIAPGWERIVIRFIIFLLFLAAGMILSTVIPKPWLILPFAMIPLGTALIYHGTVIYSIQEKIPLSHIFIDDTFFGFFTES